MTKLITGGLGYIGVELARLLRLALALGLKFSYS